MKNVLCLRCSIVLVLALAGCTKTESGFAGAGVGSAVGAGIGYAIDGGAGGALAGGLMGAIAGAAVGSATNKEESIEPAYQSNNYERRTDSNRESFKQEVRKEHYEIEQEKIDFRKQELEQKRLELERKRLELEEKRLEKERIELELQARNSKNHK